MKYLILILWLFLGGYIYCGFFSVDPFLFEGGSRPGLKLILKGVKFGFPVIWLGAGAFIFLVLAGKIKKEIVFLLSFSLIFTSFLIYLLAFHFYYIFSNATSVANLHPYLQLSPPYVEELREKKDAENKVFFIGGSSTDWEDSTGKGWPDYVEEAVNKSSPGLMASYNLAREWYTSQHSLINYSINLRHHSPDYLVIMNVINDFMVNAEFSWISTGDFQSDYRHFLGPITRLVKRPSIFSSIGEKLSGMWYFKNREVVDQSEFPGLPAYKEKLRTLIQYAKADGVKPVLVTEPYLYSEDLSEEEVRSLTMLHYTSVGQDKRWSLKSGISGMAQFTQAVRDLSREEKVPLIDLEQRIPKSGKYLRDDCHYTDEAFPLISEFVAAELTKIILSEKK